MEIITTIFIILGAFFIIIKETKNRLLNCKCYDCPMKNQCKDK